MKHLTDEELIAYAYGEGNEAAVEQHLERCAECARSHSALRSDLAEMKYAEPPARDARYGERVWETLAGRLSTYEAKGWSWLQSGVWRGLSYAAACALLVACAFAGGRLWERRQAHMTAVEHPQPAPQQAAHPPQRVVVVVLSDHLDRSERLLVELKHADAGSAEMVSPLRDEARSLLAANRIFQKSAKKDNDPALETALDRLDHLLVELANQPGGLNSATITRLQDEMNADGLLFEVRVLRSRIPDQKAAATARTEGGTL